jgi:hypothetical protein
MTTKTPSLLSFGLRWAYDPDRIEYDKELNKRIL